MLGKKGVHFLAGELILGEYTQIARLCDSEKHQCAIQRLNP